MTNWCRTWKSKKPKSMRNGASWEKKEAHCTEEDPPEYGDCWDHVILDAVTKLVVAVVIGKWTKENCLALFREFVLRLKPGHLPRLITGDGWGPYLEAISAAFGYFPPPRSRERPGGRASQPRPIPPPRMVVMFVEKIRKGSRVVEVKSKVAAGAAEQAAQFLAASPVSTKANTAFIERYNATDRHLNAGKARSTYEFSKEKVFHDAISWWCGTYYNFCWAHRSLREEMAPKRFRPRRPAMAAGLTDHIWTVLEWVTYPTLQSVPIVLPH